MNKAKENKNIVNEKRRNWARRPEEKATEIKGKPERLQVKERLQG